ncbi:hypothetical protein ACHWQZ_G001603 [Mnemiopsis leidyi]
MSNPMPTAINSNLKYSKKNPQQDIELLKKIGSGTYGEVYQARYIDGGAETAVKIVKIDAGDDWAAIQQEVIILQECKHPNIVAYMGSYLSKDRLWITMEFCSGGSVQDLYRVNGPLQEAQIAFVSRETLKGLSYLHMRNTVHRDIKGANILLTVSGAVKLADFGISATITETLGKRKSFIGTPYWMAPEVAAVETKGGYDHMCDIWAVGITAIECAEMQPPFYDMHPMKMLYMMTKNSYRSPTLKQKSKWTAKFHAFLKDALTKNAKRRPTADKLLFHPFVAQFLVADTLKSLIQGTQAQVEPEQPEEEPEPPAPEPAKPAAPKRIASRKNVKKPRREDRPESIIDQVAIPQAPPRTSSQVSATKDTQQPGQEPDENNIYDDPWHSIDMLKPPPPPKEEFDNYDSGDSDDKDPPTMQRAPLPPPENSTLKGNDAAPLPSRPPREAAPPQKPPVPVPLPPRRPTASQQPGPSAPPPPSPQQSSAGGSSAPPLPPRNPSLKAPSNAATPPRARFFTKIFSGCPLNINCAGVWTHPSKEDTYVLLGTEQGLYTLNTATKDDPTMIILSSKRVTWLNVYDKSNWLVTISGDHTYVYSHNLLLLHENVKDEERQVVRKKLMASQRLNETRGAKKACAVVNPYTKEYTCCVLTPSSFLLYLWRPDRVRFECIKSLPAMGPDYNPPLFETIIRSDEPFPSICVAVYQGENRLILENVNMNGSSVWTGQQHNSQPLPVNTLQQIESDTILVGFNNQGMFVNREGIQKHSTRTRSSLTYSTPISSLVCLEGGVLGFHKSGMEGRSLQTGRVEAEVRDDTKVFKLLSSARMIILESRVAADTTNSSNLYVLTSRLNE